MAGIYPILVALPLLLGDSNQAEPIGSWLRAQPAPESLQGLDTVLLTQINELFGSEHLPVANGAAVEPGMYVLVSPQQVFVYDEKLVDLQAGELPAGEASRESKTGVTTTLWTGFRRAWLRTVEEAQTYVVEVPTRVMIAAEASVPGHTIVELAYAAGETRPAIPPNFSLLVNGGNAGLRTRPFYLLPPGGLAVAPGDNVLGLRVTLGANEAFEVGAAHPRFAPERSGTGWTELAKVLAEVKKGYPNKSVLIIDTGKSATVGDVVSVMVAGQKHFDEFVLTDGLPVEWR